MNNNCNCKINPCENKTDGYIEIISGIDTINGRYGEVTLFQCPGCYKFWLRYFVEYESFSNSGRWYFGEIKKENIKTLTAQNAVFALEKSPKIYRGGSYFRAKQRGEFEACPGMIQVDL